MGIKVEFEFKGFLVRFYDYGIEKSSTVIS